MTSFLEFFYKLYLYRHKNSKIPKKKTKLHPLTITKEDKANNHKISKQHIFVENVPFFTFSFRPHFGHFFFFSYFMLYTIY